MFHLAGEVPMSWRINTVVGFVPGQCLWLLL